jgi:hypothetical protein
MAQGVSDEVEAEFPFEIREKSILVHNRVIPFKKIDTISVYRSRNPKLILGILLAGSIVTTTILAYQSAPGVQSTLGDLMHLAWPVLFVLTLAVGWFTWLYAWGGEGYAVYLYGSDLPLPIILTRAPLSYDEVDTIAQVVNDAVYKYKLGDSGRTDNKADVPTEPIIAGSKLSIQRGAILSGYQSLILANIVNVRVVKAGRILGLAFGNLRFWGDIWTRWLYAVAFIAAFALLLFALLFILFVTKILNPAIEGWLITFLFTSGAILIGAYYLYNILILFNIWTIIIDDGTLPRTIYKTEDRSQAQKYADLIKSAL